MAAIIAFCHTQHNKTMAAIVALCQALQRMGLLQDTSVAITDVQGVDTLDELELKQLTDGEAELLSKVVRRPEGTTPNRSRTSANIPSANIPGQSTPELSTVVLVTLSTNCYMLNTQTLKLFYISCTLTSSHINKQDDISYRSYDKTYKTVNKTR